MILPQNTIFWDLNSTNVDDLYPMRNEAKHIHAFQVPENGYIRIMISLITINSEDETLQGYFSEKPLGLPLFFGNSMVNPFVIRKNYMYDELYYGNKASIFKIYDTSYTDFDDTPFVYSKREDNTIVAQMNTTNPEHPDQTPVRKMFEIASRLQLPSGKTYYVNLTNLQNSDKTYKLMFSTDDSVNSTMPNPCPDNYKCSDGSNMFSNFRYPSSNTPGWS